MSPAGSVDKKQHQEPDDRVLTVLANQTGAIAQLNGSIAQMNGAISDIKGSVEVVKTQMGHVDGRLDDIEQSVNGGNDRRNGLFVRVDRLEEWMQREVEAAKQDRAKSNEKIERNTSSVKTVEETAKSGKWQAIAVSVITAVTTIVVAWLTRGK